MTSGRQVLVTAFALFALFFGAGNLVLPPFLGYNAGYNWPLVLGGFTVSAVVIPILAIFGHARFQGSILDFAVKLGRPYAIIYALVIYAIAISLPSPRTASVTYEMAIEPYFNISSLAWSIFYFAVVLLFVLNRSRIMDLIGKFLTPFILMLLLIIILMGLNIPTEGLFQTQYENPVSAGILEGYQTFDAIGGVVVGGVIVVSLSFNNTMVYRDKKAIIGRAGLLAGFGLIVVYTGLIAFAAHMRPLVQTSGRSDLLIKLSSLTLGSAGTALLAVLVALACFTTAVGIVAGTADFARELFGGSGKAFTGTAIGGALLGVLVGRFGVDYIIEVAVPSLMLIYPLTIVLVVLSVLSSRYTTKHVYRWVVLTTLVFSAPDFLQNLFTWEWVEKVDQAIPLSTKNLGWVIPSGMALLMANLFRSGQKVQG